MASPPVEVLTFAKTISSTASPVRCGGWLGQIMTPVTGANGADLITTTKVVSCRLPSAQTSNGGVPNAIQR